MTATADKLDLTREFRALYHPSSKEVSEVEAPAFQYLMLDGEGDPNTSADYARGVEALFSVSYGLKFMSKNGDLGLDFKVMPLESLWWADDMTDFAAGNKAKWKWTMLMLQPEFITHEMVETAVTDALRKKGSPRSPMTLSTELSRALSILSLEPLEEGRCAQIMHIGPFSEEAPTIKRLHDHIASQGLSLRGKHHEIYLSDVRRVDPAKWKTIIRQPMG